MFKKRGRKNDKKTYYNNHYFQWIYILKLATKKIKLTTTTTEISESTTSAEKKTSTEKASSIEITTSTEKTISYLTREKSTVSTTKSNQIDWSDPKYENYKFDWKVIFCLNSV